jgi:hypothetical protein
VDVSVANQPAYDTNVLIEQIHRNHVAVGAHAIESKYVRLQSG